MDRTSGERSLDGKSVLVTGASSGLGQGIAIACAAAGANVALVARREERLREVASQIEAAGRRAVICPADVGNEAAVLAAVTRAREALGSIDVLVNNAGTNVKARSVSETSSDEWRKLLDVNLTSAFLFTKALLPEMMARESGTIINISSMAAVHPSLLAGVAYSASKLGMEALTEVTNEEANPHNVRACSICPGEVNTAILDLRPSPPPPEKRQVMLQSEDLAATVLLIASLPSRAHIEKVLIKPTR
ncbi:MAG: SDR family oxidoreductase [Trueperaceae bacterium]|nr:MAG: SDR family oxidoreductase [Trueperaceae bacterium]